MRTIIINNFLFFTFGLFYYFIGIFIKYLNLNIFESLLFTTLLVIYGLLSSNLLIIFDKIPPRDTLTNMYNLCRKEKMLIFFSCMPFYKLLVLSYIYLDPVIINLLNATRVALSPIFSCIYNKDYNLCNFIIIISIIFNLLASTVPIIVFNSLDKFKINIFSIINTIISIILTTFCNIINENFNTKYDFNTMYGLNTFIIYTFVLTDILFSILLLPIIILIYYLLNNNLDNLTNVNNLYKIISYTSLIGILYGPYYILITRTYLQLKSLNICIINNLVLIFTILISCLLKLSQFNYFYILSIIVILLSSIVLTYKLEKIKSFNYI